MCKYILRRLGGSFRVDGVFLWWIRRLEIGSFLLVGEWFAFESVKGFDDRRIQKSVNISL